MKNIIYFFGILLFASSCQRDATNVKLPKDIKSLLIVHSFITPSDTLIAVCVSKSTPIYGAKRSWKDYEPLVGATVKMRLAGQNWKTFYFEANTGLYVIDRNDLPIISGQTYELEVTAKDFETVTASCTVPIGNVPDPKISQLEYKKEKQPWGDSIVTYSVKTSWQDAPETGNFYRIEKFLVVKSGFIDYDPITGQMDTVYRVAENRGWERYFNKFFDDETRNGSTISSTWKFYPMSFGGMTDSVIEARGYLLLTDPQYYRYHINMEKALESDGNPFAEPVILKGNIEGGIGIFAAYLSKEFVIKL